MRAVVCHAFGEPLVVEDVPTPHVGPGQVLIDVRAAGVNFPDSLMVRGLYQTKPELPFTPGFEVAGRVAETGAGVTSVVVGDLVMATFEKGGYAEQAVVDEWAVVKLAHDVDLLAAAGFPIVYGTAFHALVDRGGLQAGEVLLVTGAAGGVGSAAVQVGKAIGARVIAAVGSAAKAEAAEAAGAGAIVDYSVENLRERVKELTGGRGADVVFDPVGGDVFDDCVKSVAWGGRLLVVGFTSGRIPQIPANLVLLRGSSIMGVYWGAFAERDPARSHAHFETLLEWWRQATISPSVSAVYPLEEAAVALAAVAARRTTGKVVLEVSS